MEKKRRLIEIPSDGIIIIPIMDGDSTVGERRIDLSDFPVVDIVEVPHGRWISYLDGDSIMPERYYRCSECCDRGWRREWPYCPNCGAKMNDKKEN